MSARSIERRLRALGDPERAKHSLRFFRISAADIVGAHLRHRDRSLLDRLARSSSLWERRIAIIAGWMLREVGKRDTDAARAFLVEHYRRMPRTMLRYAIERFPENRRLQYLRGAPLRPP